MVHVPLQQGTSRAFPIATIRAGIAAMILLLLTSTFLTWRVGSQIRTTIDQEVGVLTAAERVAHLGSVLELAIKVVVANGDAEAALRYRTVQPRLRNTLIELRSRIADGADASDETDAVAVDQSDLALVAMQHEALALVSQREFERARRIINSNRYDELVTIYFAGTQSIADRAARFVKQSQAALDRYIRTIVALSAASLTLVILGWFALIRPARRWGEQLDQARASAEIAANQLQRSEAELKRLNRELFVQARTDPLTGLHTRLKFDEDMEELWPLIVGDGAGYCAMMCDIDFFKQYNDSYGHLAGDQVLVGVAGALAQAGRGDERLYRVGGEEILIIFPLQSGEESAARAELFRSAVERLDLAHSASPLGRVTVSIGTACVSATRPTSLASWLNRADQAMYEAKDSGRNAVVAGPQNVHGFVRAASG